MIDRHHILEERTTWSATKTLRGLRQTCELIPKIDRDVHNVITAECPIVPILGHHAMLRVAGAFEIERGDTLATLDNFLFAVEYAIDHPKVHSIERSIGALMIASLEIQKPYLVGNIITDDIGSRRTVYAV